MQWTEYSVLLSNFQSSLIIVDDMGTTSRVLELMIQTTRT